MTSQDGRSLWRGTVGWCSSPTTSEGASSAAEAGHSGSLPRRPMRKRGWSQTRQTDSANEPASTARIAGHAWCQARSAVCRPGSCRAIRSRYGFAPGAGNGALSAWAPTAPMAAPMMARVPDFIGRTPFPEGLLAGSDPAAAGGMGLSGTIPPGANRGMPRWGVAPSHLRGSRIGTPAPLSVAQPQARQRHGRPGPCPVERPFRVRRPPK